jgi:hypothetical protein
MGHTGEHPSRTIGPGHIDFWRSIVAFIGPVTRKEARTLSPEDTRTTMMVPRKNFEDSTCPSRIAAMPRPSHPNFVRKLHELMGKYVEFAGIGR